MHKTMASVASLEKIIRSQEFMPSKARLKFLKKMIILGPKTAILGPQFCRILVLGPQANLKALKFQDLEIFWKIVLSKAKPKLRKLSLMNIYITCWCFWVILK